MSIIETIKAEVERQMETARNLRINGTTQQAKEADAIIHTLQDHRNFLDTLQEKSEKSNPVSEDVDEMIDNEMIKAYETYTRPDYLEPYSTEASVHFDNYLARHFYELGRSEKPNNHLEQPVELEDEIEKCLDGFVATPTRDYFREAIKHFYALGRQSKQTGFPTTDEEMEEFLATHPKVKAPDKYKTPDWLFKQEQPVSEGLEKEINLAWGKLEKDYSPSALDKTIIIVSGLVGEKQFSNIARHFYELGRQSKPKVSEDVEDEFKRWWEENHDSINIKHTMYWYMEQLASHFAQWQKEQMEKNAVEGKVRPWDEEIWVEKDSLKGFEDGDNVRIVIIKGELKDENI